MQTQASRHTSDTSHNMTMRQKFVAFAIVSVIAVLLCSIFWQPVLWSFVALVPIIITGAVDMTQKRHAIRRLYPFLGRFRYLLESVRPEIQQYFVESETNGMPISREFRSLVYQRAKGDRDTRPFGTIFDVDRDGYEWVNHSMAPKQSSDASHRIKFGGDDCSQPYMASPLNISAMSFGSLSNNAIKALNKGAKIGGFAHNTGEGSISPYHLEHGGDLIWQIGTGYFGCRTPDGNFDPDLFTKNAGRKEVKMVEIKLSQGAKPGHGGILPAAKLTKEIADIRGVPMGQDVLSPPSHSAFNTPVEMMHFVKKLRDLSGGKPTGIKLCLGNRNQFLSICKAMIETGITPDFVTVDGSEGGTGAAPTEMTNSVGTPLKDGLITINNALIGCGLRDRVRIIAAGKIFSAFHLMRVIALGADTVNSARAMMLALGCIQSRTCNTDHCPTGIATQNPARALALDVTDKGQRVANFHHETVINLSELIAAAGLDSLEDLRPRHINRRVQGTDVQTYEQLYPTLATKCLLSDTTMPAEWKKDWMDASANSW